MKTLQENKMTKLMRLATVTCTLMMVAVLFFPIWKIELAAPQYPEGLVLKIHAHKLAGNVEVINGLNHYIGMRQLHEDDFMEFTVLPYIIGGFAFIGLITFFLNRRKFLNAWVILFVVIAIVSMVDFYRWEYNYGHELNPDAPIKVPGMAYQPPLIGYKQLLNFGAYSIPDIGGWLFVAIGLTLVTVWFVEFRKHRKPVMKHSRVAQFALAIPVMITVVSCSTGPKPIQYGTDACDFCKMTIVDERFSAQCMTTKGKSFHFDDMHCLISFMKNGGVWRNELAGVYLSDFNTKNTWIKSDSALILSSDLLRSPMGGNLAAFSTEKERENAMTTFKGEKTSWESVNPFEGK